MNRIICQLPVGALKGHRMYLECGPPSPCVRVAIDVTGFSASVAGNDRNRAVSKPSQRITAYF